METRKPISTAGAAAQRAGELPLVSTYHPLGFPLHLATNSPDVLESAAESWGMWSPESDSEPIEIRVTVEEEGDLALEPEYRARGHLFSAVADRHNYAVLDLDRLSAYAVVSRRTAGDHAWLRWYFLDLMALYLLEQRHVAAVHAACVARDGRGILLAGPSSAGKSTLAWACARAGWTYLSDDATWQLAGSDGRVVLGRPHVIRFRHDAPRHFPDLAGYISRVRPNGKLSIEVPTSAFPHVRTAARCRPAAVVFLDRRARCAAGIQPLDAEDAVAELLGEVSLHREETLRRHRILIGRLLQAPAFRLRYKSLEEGVALVEELHAGLRD